MHNQFIVYFANSCNGLDTNIIGCSEGGGISTIIKTVLNIIFAGISILATVGLILVGVRYMAARDDESQVAMAKKRALDIVIGLVAAGTVWVVVSLVLPGVDESTIDGTLSKLDDAMSSMPITRPGRIAEPYSSSSHSSNPSTSGQSSRPSSQPSSQPSSGSPATSVYDAVWNNGNECSGAKYFPGKKYALTEEEIRYFSELVRRENCSSSKQSAEVILGCKLLATQIINLYEEREFNRGGKEGCNSSGQCFYKNMKKWVTSDEWYNCNKKGPRLQPGKELEKNPNPRQAVIDVIVNGNRVMPKFVTRYDGLYHWTEHRSGFINMPTIEAASKAVPMKTKVKSSGDRYLWCIERKKTRKETNGPYNEVFNYDNSYKKKLGL